MHHRVQPDIYTSRIDLSATHAPIGRGTDAHWCNAHNYFDYSLLQVEITALGYFRKMEANVLEKLRPGEFRWYGFLVQKNVMSREDCSIRSLTPWLLMSQYVSVLLVTEEWAGCRLLYFRFWLSVPAVASWRRFPFLDACGQ